MTTSKKIKLAITISIGLYALYNQYQTKKPNTQSTTSSSKEVTNHNKKPSFNYLPSSTTNQIVKHNGYTLSYNEKHEIYKKKTSLLYKRS